tara:strand:+ start:648 stop:1196 length:549 start_codon:yes stop_codon:yes gene_type:complete
MNLYNFIETYKTNLNICDNLINYHKKNKEYKNAGTVGNGLTDKKLKDSTDVYFYNNSSNKFIIKFFKELSTHVQNYVTKYNIGDDVNTCVCNTIQHYKPGKGFPAIHYERGNKQMTSRQLVYMLYLNTVKDKGGTTFPYQKTTTKAIKGNLIIWPAEFTHPHHGVISPTEEKYIATGWLEIV